LAWVILACGSATAPTPTPSRCQPAGAALVSAISTGLDEGLTLSKANVVRSEDFEEAYFVAADLQGPGLDGSSDIATWVSNRSDGSGLIYSVGSVSAEFSSWGSGEDTDAGFSLSDDGASEAADCARAG
jgi:hypothetical protein